MLMRMGERWQCTNPLCYCEVLVQTNGTIDGRNPVCACGGLMKKKYVSPQITYLEFLRDDEPLGANAGRHRE
jgi:hypothetical protein